MAAEIKVSADENGEHESLDQYDPQRPPPHQAAMPESIAGQVRDINDRSLFHWCSSAVTNWGCASEASCSWCSFLLGQNHAVRVMKTGIDPIGTAQGVKIEPMNSPVTAIAVRKGQIEG